MHASSSPVHMILIVFFIVLEATAAGIPFAAPNEPYRGRLIAAGLVFLGLSLLF